MPNCDKNPSKTSAAVSFVYNYTTLTMFVISGVFSPQSLGPVLILSHHCNRRDLGSSRHLRQASWEKQLAIRVRRRLRVTGKDYVKLIVHLWYFRFVWNHSLSLFVIAGTFATCVLSFGSECKLILFILFQGTCLKGVRLHYKIDCLMFGHPT